MAQKYKNLLVVGYGRIDKAKVISGLSNQLGWKPKMWIAKSAYEADLNSMCPDLLFYSNEYAENRTEPSFLSRENISIVDSEVVSRLARYETVMWPLFLRRKPEQHIRMGMDLKHEYHKQITFFYRMFKEASLEAAIFSHMPHHFYTYVLYLLCKEFGVETYVPVRTKLAGRPEMFVSSFEVGAKDILEWVTAQEDDEDADIVLSTEDKKQFNSLRSEYKQAMPEYTKRRFILSAKSGKLISRSGIVSQLIGPLKVLRNWKRPSEIVASYKMVFGRRALLKRYNQLSVVPRIDQKYVLVCLHRQPEASSSPTGGIFVYQHMMVDLISRAIPSDWKIYVKEHPSQLYWQTYNNLFRTPNYYDELLSINKVSLVRPDEPVFDLVDNAQAVAVVAGSTGWEAAVRQKPVLVFGAAWYKYCEGVFNVHDQESCVAAFEKIKAGYVPSLRKIKLYFNAWRALGVEKFGASLGDNIKEDESEVYSRDRVDKLVSQIMRARLNSVTK